MGLLPTHSSLVCGLTKLKTEKTPSVPRESEKRGSRRLRGGMCELCTFFTCVRCDFCSRLASAALLEEDCGISVSSRISPYLGNKEVGMRLERRAAEGILYSS